MLLFHLYAFSRASIVLALTFIIRGLMNDRYIFSDELQSNLPLGCFKPLCTQWFPPCNKRDFYWNWFISFKDLAISPDSSDLWWSYRFFKFYFSDWFICNRSFCVANQNTLLCIAISRKSPQKSVTSDISGTCMENLERRRIFCFHFQFYGVSFIG